MLRAIAIAALVGVTIAQPEAGCANEIVDLAQAGGVAGLEACQLLARFELCVSQIENAQQRSSLEVELTQKQQQYATCSEEPLSASIRTSQDAIDFAGRDFTFHRTTRQSLNLYEMRDQVTGFAGDISTAVVSMQAMQATMENMTGRIAGLEHQIAAQDEASTPCIPYVEYTASNGACVQLNRTCEAYNTANLYESARPTRTSDRVCAPVTMCNADQWEFAGFNAFNDRVCRPVTNCSINTNGNTYTAAPATATSDATCILMPGMSADSPIPGRAGCRGLVGVPGVVSGFFWVSSAGSIRQVYCDMEHLGGGWTMVGRGKGQSLNCWRNSNSDCNYQYSRADQHQYTGLTFRMSNTWINGMTYSSIRFQGTNLVQGNHYWAGKDNTEHPTCTYVHWRVATGNCNCASSSVNMANRRCGRNYGGHFGAGDWPSLGGGLMTGHVSNGWYIKRNPVPGPINDPNGYCNGRSSGRCDVALWIR